MAKIQLTKISSRGQIVIPKNIRSGISTGTPFVVIRKGDTFVLKRIRIPPLTEFEKLVSKGVEIAKEQKLREEDIEKIIQKHRKR